MEIHLELTRVSKLFHGTQALKYLCYFWKLCSVVKCLRNTAYITSLLERKINNAHEHCKVLKSSTTKKTI